MADYQLTPEADADLLAIARYTVRTWGIVQARRYEALLRDSFDGIASRRTRSRKILESRPEIRFVRCEHHYVFFQVRAKEPPLIVAIFHERMDLIRQLRHRLEP